jgi:hypothetical protein
MGTLNAEIPIPHVGHIYSNICILFAYVLYCMDFFKKNVTILNFCMLSSYITVMFPNMFHQEFQKSLIWCSHE